MDTVSDVANANVSQTEHENREECSIKTWRLPHSSNKSDKVKISFYTSSRLDLYLKQQVLPKYIPRTEADGQQAAGLQSQHVSRLFCIFCIFVIFIDFECHLD